MDLIYNVTYAFHEKADPLVNAYYLRAFIDALVAINIAVVRSEHPPFLYDSGVRYKRTHVWEPIPELYLANKVPIRGNKPFYQPEGVAGGVQGGDCKSLASALIAFYMVSGKPCQPTFRWARRGDGSGALDYHILVQTADGFEDPSKVLGMSMSDLAKFYATHEH